MDSPLPFNRTSEQIRFSSGMILQLQLHRSTFTQFYQANLRWILKSVMSHKFPKFTHQFPQTCPPLLQYLQLATKQYPQKCIYASRRSPQLENLSFFFLLYSMVQGMPSTLHSLSKMDNSLQVQYWRYNFLGRSSIGRSRNLLTTSDSSISSTSVSCKV